jgi:hypothetical protein
MDTQTLESLEIPEDIVNNLMKFSPERRKQVFDFVRFLAQPQEENINPTPPQRVLGLHQGMGWMSDDFDSPLPDEFWLGES